MTTHPLPLPSQPEPEPARHYITAANQRNRNTPPPCPCPGCQPPQHQHPHGWANQAAPAPPGRSRDIPPVHVDPAMLTLRPAEWWATQTAPWRNRNRTGPPGGNGQRPRRLSWKHRWAATLLFANGIHLTDITPTPNGEHPDPPDRTAPRLAAAQKRPQRAATRTAAPPQAKTAHRSAYGPPQAGNRPGAEPTTPHRPQPQPRAVRAAVRRSRLDTTGWSPEPAPPPVPVRRPPGVAPGYRAGTYSLPLEPRQPAPSFPEWAFNRLIADITHRAATAIRNLPAGLTGAKKTRAVIAAQTGSGREIELLRVTGWAAGGFSLAPSMRIRKQWRTTRRGLPPDGRPRRSGPATSAAPNGYHPRTHHPDIKEEPPPLMGRTGRPFNNVLTGSGAGHYDQA